jgi:predicted alpha/beta superfamily hydrolase
MKKCINSLLIVLLVILSGKVLGQNIAPADMLKMTGNYVRSTVNGKTYQLFVSLPKNYNPHDTIRYPVLYFLDGYYSFPIIAPTHFALDFANQMKKVIIVSIADSVLNILNWSLSRLTDLTPSFSESDDSAYAEYLHLPPGITKSGGGADFLKTLRFDIIPFIDKQYKTTNDRGIAGHSLGGLFTAYCLLTAPDLFNRYGINSPSFWWDKKMIFAMEKSFSKKNKVLKARVYMSIGSLEQDAVSNMTSFADSLNKRNYEGLELSFNIFDNETHESVIPAMISRNLRVLYSFNDQKTIILSNQQFQKFVGTFEIQKDLDIKFILENDQLYAQLTGQNAIPIYPESETEFFYKILNAQIQFIKNGKGDFDHMILLQDGEKYEGKRIN